MGGKKKTKWRKLPLEEFTKDCPELQRKRSFEEKKTDTKKTDPTDSVSCSSTQETADDSRPQSSTEYNENTEGVWFPTHYLIYNPMELPPMYPNFLVPNDGNYYYYPPTEVNEYGPNQEFIPPFKDTVYLIFPTSALRPPQVPSYDWRNRRRRRRYGGYAEYAVIPDKTSVDEKDKTTVKTNPSSQLEKSNKEKELNSINEKTPSSTQDSEILKGHNKIEDKCEYKKMGLSNDERNGVSSNNPKKNIDACGIHGSSREKVITDNNLNTEKDRTDDSMITAIESFRKQVQKEPESLTEANSLNETFSENQCREINQTSSKLASCLETVNDNTEKDHNLNKHSTSNAFMQNTVIASSSKKELDNAINLESIFDTEDINEEEYDNSSSASLSDDMSQTFSTANIPNNINRTFTPVHKSSNINRSIPKSNQILSESSYVPYVCKSDILNSDSEIIHKQPLKCQTMPANTSIYKLAYDENITDQSDSRSRSPSPMDPESQMPSSLISHEINVYEADSGDEAGSEDLELIPHRYESESFLNKNKHVYENKLSLAVELLRTKESLPYDAQFKRVSEEAVKSDTLSDGQVNLGFQGDLNILENIQTEDKYPVLKSNMVITDQLQTQLYPSQNSPTFDISLENSLTESCEIADEVVNQDGNPQEMTEEVRTGRSGAQFRHYFSPRSVLSTWNCCIVM